MRQNLTEEDVLNAAVNVLDEFGLDGLTLRAVAEVLGVRHNTVTWHIQSKRRLLELMSDSFFSDCLKKPLPTGWRPRVEELVYRGRGALLAHRDGARLMAGLYSPLHNILSYAEAVLGSLKAGGFSPEEASRTHWTLFYFTLGITQEQQSTEAPTGELADTVSAETYPLLHASRAEFTQDRAWFDKQFKYGVDLLLDAAFARVDDKSAGQRLSPRPSLRRTIGRAKKSIMQ
jgi:TetR/AcrR family transcriptional regulator, tetracycline repressor protein